MSTTDVVVYRGFECVTLSIVVKYVKFGFREISLSDSVADLIRGCTLFHITAYTSKERACIPALPQGMDRLLGTSILGSEGAGGLHPAVGKP